MSRNSEQPRDPRATPTVNVAVVPQDAGECWKAAVASVPVEESDETIRRLRAHLYEIRARVWRKTQDPQTIKKLVEQILVTCLRSLDGYDADTSFREWLRDVEHQVFAQHFELSPV